MKTDRTESRIIKQVISKGRIYINIRKFSLKIIMKFLNSGRNMGVTNLSFWVKRNNTGVVEFYDKAVYELSEDIITMNKIL